MPTAKIREIVTRDFGASFAGENLFESLSSIEIVLLVCSLEEEFGVTIEPLEVDASGFGSLESLASLIRAKTRRDVDPPRTL